MKKTISRLLFFIGLPLLNHLFFPAKIFNQSNYWAWFVAQGPLITLSFALLSVIWIDLERYQDLISANPRLYLAACLITYAGVFHTVKKAIDSSLHPSNTTFDQPLSWGVFDHVLNILLSILMIVIGAFWFISVAPIMYFINLAAGAPARASLRNPNISAVVTIEDHIAQLGEINGKQQSNKSGFGRLRELEQRVADIEQSLLAKLKTKEITQERYDEMIKRGENLRMKISSMIEKSPKMTFDLTLAQRPVAVTAVLASVLLFVTKLLVNYPS